MENQKCQNDVMYTYDIFDTIIFRKCGCAKNIFKIMQDLIVLENGDFEERWSLVDFASRRTEAEILARRFAKDTGNIEVTLEEIYLCFKYLTGLSKKKIEYLQDMEIKVETEQAIGNSVVIKEIKKKIANREKVILISDMYLSSDTIRKLLVNIDVIFKNIPIYVSNEYGCVKSDGSLFRLIKEKEGANYKKWIHKGDNRKSDYIMPCNLGIHGIWNKRELKSTQENSIDFKNIVSYEEIGYLAAHYVMSPFIFWIISICEKNHIRDIFFVLRDGYFLKIIADKMIKCKNLDVRTHYIYGSRAAWNIQKGDRENCNLKGYLSQLFDACGEKFAIVDVQGTGKSMSDMLKTLGNIKNIEPHVFYFDMLKTSYLENIICYSYKSPNECKYIERLCRAPFGATKGYVDVAGKYTPILETVENNFWVKSGLAEYESGIHCWIEENLVIGRLYRPVNYEETLCFLKYISETEDDTVRMFFNGIPFSSSNQDEKLEIGEAQVRYLVKDTIYKNVLIYGLGVRGQRLTQLLEKHDEYKIVGWIDSDFERKAPNGEYVISVRQSKDVDADAIILTMADKNTAENLKQLLIEVGVPNEKIIMYDDLVECLD